MNRKLKRVGLFAVVLPTLTGCTEYRHTNFELMKIPQWIDKVFSDMRLGFMQFLNETVASSIENINEISNNTFQTVVEQLASYSTFGTVVSVVSFLAVLAILVRFGYAVWKNNFSANDTSYAPSIIEMIKKTCVAMCCVFAIPYMCVTGFLAASAAGTLVSSYISETNDVQKWEIYDYMDDAGINFSTLCYEGQVEAGARTLTSLDGSDPSKTYSEYDIITPENASRFGIPEGYNYSGTAYDFWCNGAGELKSASLHPLNVWQSFIYSHSLSAVVPVGSSENKLTGADAGTLEVALLVIGLAAVALGSIWSVVKRCVDLLILVFTSWWYIGASISDVGNQSSLGEFGKKALSIFLSQFLFSMLLSLFSTLVLASGNLHWAVVLAWTLVILGTPTAVQEMVNDTGAAGDMAAAGKIAYGGAKSIFKHFTK